MARAAATITVLAEERSSCIWSTISSSSRGVSHRANWPRYAGMYWEISVCPVSRTLDSSTATSFRRSGVSTGAMASREAPAIRRTTMFSLTFIRLEKWVAMWSTLAWSPCSTWSSRYSTPTAFSTQGVADFRLSRNTLLTASCRSSRPAGRRRPAPAGPPDGPGGTAAACCPGSPRRPRRR